MKISAMWQARNSAANYRVIEPLRAMQRRGHEIAWPNDDGSPVSGRLTSCDVVHVHRRHDERTRRLVKDLAAAGIAVTYDNDDDFTSAPKEHPHYALIGGAKGRRMFEETLEVARTAQAVSSPSEIVADKFRREGVVDVEVIPNHLLQGIPRRRRRHDGLVIGWIAGWDHAADAKLLDLRAALADVLGRCPGVLVECIGVHLRLPERYRHDGVVSFSELPDRIGGFDIGLAPLADIPFNRARSDIKVKEYAASGVPWLASPVGPYRSLGEEQGGRLVSDGAWTEEIVRLVERRREQRRLGRRGARWAKGQTIEASAGRWEALFERARAGSESPRV